VFRVEGRDPGAAWQNACHRGPALHRHRKEVPPGPLPRCGAHLKGGPGSSLPDSLATTRATELVTVSLYFSSPVRMGMLSPTTESMRSSPTAAMKARPPVSAPSLPADTTSSRPDLSWGQGGMSA
jgi:hypothetical protein